MIKVIPPGAQDFDDATSYMVKVSSRGLVGNDLSEFVKRAGHKFAHEVKNMELKSGDVPVHLIAIGAGEWYSANRNHDLFNEQTCKNYHDTFVKHSRFMRNHNNRPHSPHYGTVKSSMYNDTMHRIELLCILNGTKQAAKRNGGYLADKEMEKLANNDSIAVSMACGKAGTLVRTDNGFKRIEDIKVGDNVLTHKGRYRKVYASTVRKRHQYLRIKLPFCGRQILEFTPDHEFYVARWQDIPRKSAHRNGLKSKDKSGFSKLFRRKYRSQVVDRARWLPCGQLKAGDLLLMPIYYGTGKSGLTVKEARLLGYYISEGTIIHGTSRGIAIHCHKDDTVLNEIKDILPSKATATIRNHYVSDKGKIVSICRAAELETVCRNEIGRGVRNKKIPNSVYDASDDVKLAFMSTWLNGDGWQDGKGIHWSTCSKSLSIELQMLLASVGIPASIYKIEHTSDLPRGRERTGVGVEYTINISNRYSDKFTGISKAKHITNKATKTTSFIDKGYLAIPVELVETVNEDVDVYDISVLGDHSFTAFGFAVHNCTLPYDECNSCHNKARNKSEYCDETMCKYGGLKKNLGKVFDDGFYLCADNPHPKFFDISHVFRPADRIAYVLGKIAADSDFSIGGAELAEQLGIYAPPDISSDLPNVVSQYKLAHELANIENDIYGDKEFAKFSLAFSIPRTDISFDKNWAIKDILAALSMEKIALPVRGFLKLLGCNNDDIKAASHKVAGNLPNIYTRLISRRDADDLIENNAFIPSLKLPSVKMREWASKLAADYSVRSDAIETRIVRAALNDARMKSPRNMCKAASANDPVENLAIQYALYKLAFLDSLSRTDNFNLTCETVIRQNYLD